MDRTDIQRQPEKIIRAGLLHARKHRQETGDTNCMLVRLARFWAWLQYRQCFIRDTHEKIIPLVPNRAQCMMFAIMLLQAMAGRPIRIVVLKARKVGITTFVKAAYYFIAKFYRNQKAVLLAHQSDSTDEIFAITKTIGMYDQFQRPKDTKRLLTFHNHSSYWCHTAGGEGNVGAGGTPNMLHRSELALWKTGIKRQSDTTSGRAVPMTPTSCIIDESTARGQDLFWGRFKAAQHDWHPYEALFVPWFADSSLRVVVPDGGLKLAEDEVGLIARARDWGIEIPMEALQWRRHTIAEIGADDFRQEHPSTPQEAISVRRGLVVPGLHECVIDELPFLYRELETSKRKGGYDYGYRDPTVLMDGVYVDQVLYVTAVYRCTEQLPADYAHRISTGHSYSCDPSEPGPIEDLNRLAKGRATFRPAPRAHKGTDRTLVKREFDMLRKLALTGRLKILRECADQLLVEGDSFEYDERTGEPNDTRTPECGHFDTLTALRYMAMGVLVGGGVVKSRAPRRTSFSRQLRSL